MNKLYLLILGFSLYYGSLLGQDDYIPLVVEDATWITWEENDYMNLYHAWRIQGDTIVNDTAYKKVYYIQLLPDKKDPYIIDYIKLGAIIREDIEAKKVYARQLLPSSVMNDCNYIDFMETEYLLHDFSLEVGDTISTCQSGVFESEVHIITSIEQKDLFGKERKTFNYQDINVGSYFALSEGIGNFDGLFSTFNPVFSPGDGGSQLMGHCEGELSACGLSTSVKDPFFSDLEYTIFPNPVHDLLTIESRSRISDIKFYNILGQFLSDYSGNQVDISDLESGLYVVSFKVGGKSVEEMIIKK